jgi:hypothetical protein
LGAIREVNSCLLSGGALDSQVHHRTCTVQCPVQIAFLNWCSRPLKIWSRWRTGQSGAPIRPLARPHVTRGLHGRPLAHRTVRCTTGQSDAPPDSPMIFSHTLLTVSRERRLRCRRLTGHCPVHHRTVRCTQTEQPFGCTQPTFLQNDFSCF